MNILFINGSPRHNGMLSKMLNIMKEEAINEGAIVNEVFVNDLKIEPCKGCMICRSKNECVLPQDGAQQTLAMIKQADVLVVASPCNWGNINGYTKMLFDRMVYGLMGESESGIPKPLHKGKKAIIVSTSTTIFPFNILFNQTHGVIKAFREILRWSGYSIIKTIEKGGTKKKTTITTNDINKCKKAIKKLHIRK